MERAKRNPRVMIRRELLLVEIERRCPKCETRARTGLTKDEAFAYQKFYCERCEEWTPDALTERDVPEWWEELTIRSLAASERGGSADGTDESYEPSATVLRLNQDARRAGKRFEDIGEDTTAAAAAAGDRRTEEV